MSGPAEGKSARGRLLLWGCSYRAAPPVAAGRRTHGVGEAAADVSGPVEGARARGSSSSGGARKGGSSSLGRSSSGGAPPLAAWNGGATGEKKERRGKKDGVATGGKEDGVFFAKRTEGWRAFNRKITPPLSVATGSQIDGLKRKFPRLPWFAYDTEPYIYYNSNLQSSIPRALAGRRRGHTASGHRDH